jgi:hypothetical protein
LSRNTDGQNSNSGDGLLIYVDAKVDIEAEPEPTGYQQVGNSYVFTVYVQRDDGFGAEFIPTDSGSVSVTLSHSDLDPDAIINIVNDSCTDGTVDGKCTVEFTTNKTGTVTGSAEANVKVADHNIPVTSGEVSVTFVDANISIDQAEDTNGIGEDHEFTVTVKVDDGSGGGLDPFEGATPEVTVSPIPNSGPGVCGTTDSEENFVAGTDEFGRCTVVIRSDVVETFTANASVNLDHLEGLLMSRETNGDAGPGGSLPVTKAYVSGSLIWFKQDSSGNPLGGATFQVCRTHDRFDTDIPDECDPVIDNSSPDLDPDDGEFLLDGLFLGVYTIEETVPPLGYLVDEVSARSFTLDIDNQVNPEATWVNTPPLGCTAGWWKNSGLGAFDDPSDELAQEVTAAVVVHWNPEPVPPEFDGTHGSLFRHAFNLSKAQMTARGLDPKLTLLSAVKLGGGDFNALARQGTSALLNSRSISYEFGAEEILKEVHDAFFNPDVVGDLITKYDTANKRDHSSCPTG